MQAKRSKETGVTFIEVLIAVVVLSVGFLATTRMQVMGMRYNQSSFMKSQAGIMASNMADRMRSNVDGVRDGMYNAIDTTSLPGDPGCIVSGCNSTQLAQLDVRQWGLKIADSLPDGVGTVDVNANLYQINVNWSESTNGAPQTQTVSIWLTP